MDEKELIRNNFPELTIKEFKDSSNGMDHTVLIADEKFVFRIAKSDEYKKVVATELALLDALNSSFAPNYKFRSNEVNGYPLLPGKSLTHESFEAIEDKDRFCKEVSTFLTKLHTLDPPQGIQEVKQWYGVSEIPRIQDKLSQHLDEDWMAFVQQYYEHMIKVTIPHRCVIHGDLHADHVLVDKELKGFIDFSDVRICDPAVDFQIFWEYGGEIVEVIYENYGGQKDPHFLVRAKLYNVAEQLALLRVFEDLGEPNLKRKALARLKVLREELKGVLHEG